MGRKSTSPFGHSLLSRGALPEPLCVEMGEGRQLKVISGLALREVHEQAATAGRRRGLMTLSRTIATTKSLRMPFHVARVVF